ncbi:FG-GAP-like repeat-containing protein [Lewinella sp. JB7]|uniref:FG-GAP-like repeat-containing protein n=1 Tax=Lewinella sp. JB7 TaxID=2962887 RepID=UPI0020C9CF13|nr:FG-GAP-like repeat-containing protein [Lewinella sp. JB7]MCP9235848.1 FG-GAP-like repeat-containing protein [Lewinella sp. JB7]
MRVLVVIPVVLSLSLCGQTFTEVAAAAGVRHRTHDPHLIAGGVVWFDYNGDRYPDLFLTGGGGNNHLYRNNWDGTFTDVTVRAGLHKGGRSVGAVSGDFDGDGDPDLFVTTDAGEPNLLFRNGGDGRFTEVHEVSGITQASYSTAATVGDFDGDGLPDIYVANYLATHEPRDGGLPNFYYHNEGGFRFTEQAATLGLDDRGCGLGAVLTDLDDDGDRDLIVANDYGYLVSANEVWLNESPLHPRAAARTGLNATVNAMGVAVGDYDRDGDLDYYITNIRDNLLYENLDAGEYFAFQSNRTGTSLAERTSWGAAFADFDNDGYPDLAVANGQIVENGEVEQADVLYRGSAYGKFTDVSDAAGFTSVTRGRGLAAADYDLDGDVDIAINVVSPSATAADPALLYRNDSAPGNWLTVRLQDPQNYEGKVTAYVDGTPILREVDGGSSYLSQANAPLHFGLGAATTVDSIVIRWPDKTLTCLKNIAANQHLEVRKDGRFHRYAHRNYGNGSDFTFRTEMITATDGTDSLLLITRGDAATVATDVLSDEFVFHVSPNPARDVLTITHGLTTASRLHLFDLRGKQLLQESLPGGLSPFSIDLSDLPPGLYLCRITSGSRAFTQKILHL